MDVIRALVFHFVEDMTNNTFNKKFFVVALEVRLFLEWEIEVEVLAAKSIYQIMNKWAGTHSRSLEK